MTDRLAGFRGVSGAGVCSSDDYDQLPVPVKVLYTRQQWLWLSDGGKAGLIQRECEPEVFDE